MRDLVENHNSNLTGGDHLKPIDVGGKCAYWSMVLTFPVRRFGLELRMRSRLVDRRIG